MDTTTNFLFFNSRDELLRLDISKIVYFESDGNYIQYNTYEQATRYYLLEFSPDRKSP